MQGSGNSWNLNAVLTYAEPTLVSVSAVASNPVGPLSGGMGLWPDPFAPETTVFGGTGHYCAGNFCRRLSRRNCPSPPGGMNPTTPKTRRNSRYWVHHAHGPFSDAAANPAESLWNGQNRGHLLGSAAREAHYVIDRSWYSLPVRPRRQHCPAMRAAAPWAKDPPLD